MLKRLIQLGIAIILLFVVVSSTNAQYTYYLPVIIKTDPIPTGPPTLLGVAVPHSEYSCNDARIVGADWYYNWLPYTWPPGCPNTKTFVPMIWGDDGEVNMKIAMIFGMKSGWVLGFNEPDRPEQANMTPMRAAILWHQMEEEAKRYNVKLVSPATSQYGVSWFDEMVSQYTTLYGKEPHFDAIAIHIYTTNLSELETYVLYWIEKYPATPIWVTEYNTCLIGGDHPELYKSFTIFLMSQPEIARTAWFVSRETDHPDTQSPCALINSSNSLSSVGIEMKRE